MLSTEQLLIFLGVLVATVVLMKWRKKKKDVSTYRNPPSLPSLPLIGSLGLMLFKNVTNSADFFMKTARELGPIFTLRLGSRPAAILNSREAIEKAFVKNASAFSDRPEIFIDAIENPGNRGIIFIKKVSDWKRPQQLALSILKEFGFGLKSIMETRIYKEIEAVTEYVIDKRGESFDPNEMCILATSNIITNIIFGRRRDYKLGVSQLSAEMERMVSQISFIYDMLPVVRFLPSYRKQMKTYIDTCKTILKYIEAEVLQCVENPAEPCFVQSYIQKEGPDYDRAQLNHTLRDLVSAGTDTTAATLQWAFVALANNPDVQKRLHAEIDAVMTGDRLPTLQDEAELPYTVATILEITRWRTLTPLSSPRLASRSTVVDGYLIPEGTTVFANLYAVHSDIDVCKDPEVFRPERFLDSENNVIGKNNVIPFSVGRRSCLGETLARAELFLIFTNLVKRFLVLPPEGQDRVNEDPKVPVGAIMYLPPFKIRLTERN